MLTDIIIVTLQGNTSMSRKTNLLRLILKYNVSYILRQFDLKKHNNKIY